MRSRRESRNRELQSATYKAEKDRQWRDEVKRRQAIYTQREKARKEEESKAYEKMCFIERQELKRKQYMERLEVEEKEEQQRIREENRAKREKEVLEEERQRRQYIDERLKQWRAKERQEQEKVAARVEEE